MKHVVAVKPWYNDNAPMHEMSAFTAWQDLGGSVCTHTKPPRLFDGILYRYLLPSLSLNDKEARLKFLSGQAVKYLSFPDYINYEIIPLFWDSWPCYHKSIISFLKKKKVRTAFFTSSQVAKMMMSFFPLMNIKYIPEGIDPTLYHAGELLKNRNIDVLEYGRIKNLYNIHFPNHIKHLYSKKGKRLFATNQDFFNALGQSKVTLCFPRNITNPNMAGNIETLTQRYWENMLSRIVMIGKSPKELIDLIGYDPVIPIDEKAPKDQIIDVLLHIDDYQSLVDKNRENAIEKGQWTTRVLSMRKFLKESGYKI